MSAFLPVLVVLFFAVLVEAVWERLQDGIPAKYLPPWLKVWGAVFISILVCVFYRIDLVAIILGLLVVQAAEAGIQIDILVGFTVVGAILTGFLISRGGDGVHKLLTTFFTWLGWVKTDKAPLTYDGPGALGGDPEEPVNPLAGVGG